MQELICNLHIHSIYSDGTGSYDDILDAAAQAGVEILILTDHNILVKGVEGYYQKKGKNILLLTGEEVHNQDRQPQKDHMLVFGVDHEVAQEAYDPQHLIDSISQAGGSSFIAHPDEHDLPLLHESAITWEDWGVKGYTGFELWNGMSEFKTVSRKFSQVVRHAFFPELVAHHPPQQTLQRWDQYLTDGRHLSVIGGTDSHALHIKMGPFTKTVFPYKFHFSTINDHLLLREGLTSDLDQDKQRVFEAIKHGSLFIGYDLPASTRGFSFKIESEHGMAEQGESLLIGRSGLVHIKLPRAAETILIHNGKTLYRSTKFDHIAYPVTEPGAYRVECYIDFLGEKRGWIFSNPIYLTRENVP
jgi:hypothetical protein